ncbi:MAG TPA: PD-(D/E)XK nuclease family protein [Methylotenera sp.]|nr:PD-(D/E)XK nuclease family protein [Methylotenera sp.]
MPLPPATIVICSTARLVRGVLLREQLEQIAAGQKQWQSLAAYTLPQWLEIQLGNAMLMSTIPSDALPTTILSEVAEAFLWEQAISTCLAKHEAAALFDIRALAKSAMDANQLMYEWCIDETEVNQDYISQETRQFLRWRHTFQALCQQQNAIESAHLMALQIKLIQKHIPDLPARILLAGFDRITPLEQTLLDFFKARGVEIQRFETFVQQETDVQYHALLDCQAECRAVVAWAKNKLADNPNAQLAIVSPVLGNIRRELADLLDDTFHPETLNADLYETPRCYDFSLGLALTEYPIVQSALQLLRFTLSKPTLGFEDVNALLQDIYWGSIEEIDTKALLDAYLRQHLNATYSLEKLLAQTNRFCSEYNATLEVLKAHLNTIQEFSRLQPQQRQPLSYWILAFVTLLDSLNWAKTRSISSHEYQQKNAFSKCIGTLKTLDKVFGNVTALEALQKLNELCANTMFQPESKGQVRIQLLGLLETPALQQDAVWVMNMNDQHWPPQVRLNPLLPAELQRAQGTPNASASVQSTFASLVHQRWLATAKEVIFSYAIKEQDRELRPSPLLNTELVQIQQAAPEMLQTLAEQYAKPATMEMLDDSMAPAIGDDEKVRGGTKLFATQAICPAWAFYQYRLGARKLETPMDGLDNLSRGSLLHKVLQNFWQDCQDSKHLKAMDESQLTIAIDVSIEKSISDLNHELSFNLPAQILQIERQRLKQLMQYWLALEVERADFSVLACEKKYQLNIEGLSLNLAIDRIDNLPDGGILVIDYKTSNTVTNKTWGDDRIAEPQLPIYAALALKDEQVVAVCFGKVRTDETKFVGLSSTPDILPEVCTLDKVRGNAFKRFESWDALVNHWQLSLLNIASEIRSGVASVTFANETDLEFCDVKPLLRLPERQMQFEHLQSEKPQQSNKPLNEGDSA